MRRKRDVAGIVFGKLIAIKMTYKSQRNQVYWLCKCECGNYCNVRIDALSSGQTRSCGCLKRIPKPKHGMSYTPTYSTWVSMIQRCANPNNIGFSHYGGRGIKVCERWISSFENFYADMGDRPTGKTIDRINNDGDYEPDNCKWSTPKEQSQNQSSHKKHHPSQKYFLATKPGLDVTYLSCNQSEFARNHSIYQNCISLCLRGKIKQTQGWEFKPIL